MLVCFAALGLFVFFLNWYSSGLYSQEKAQEPELAFWMEHAWHTVAPPDIDELKKRIDEHGIDTLYFHVGPLGEQGQLPEDLMVQTELLNQLPTENHAWIGQIRDKIELDNPDVRTTIVSESSQLLEQGFDGIHIDIEPVRAHDEAFLLLVAELRAAHPETQISIAMDEWQPYWIGRILNWAFDINLDSDWNTKQVQVLASLVDQMVVMTYDTQFKDPLLYQWWVEQQTIFLSRIVPKGTELYIGVPSYHSGLAIDPTVENVQTGINGFQQGRYNIRSMGKKVTGLAIYSYWEMQEHEWALLKQLNPSQ